MLEINPSAGNLPERRNYTGRIEILEKLSGENWKVKAGHQIMMVKSAAGLVPGEILTGMIVRKGGVFYLQLPMEQGGVKGHPVLFESSSDAFRKIISFIITETGKKPDPALLRIIETLSLPFQKNGEQQAGMAAHAFNRGFRTADALSGLIDAVSDYSGSGSGGGQPGKGKDGSRRGRAKPGFSMPSAVAAAESSGSLLYAFNHIKSGEKHWIVIPYKTGEGKKSVSGSIRFAISGSVIREIAVHAEKNGSCWYFHLTSLEKPHKTLKIYADEAGTAALRGKKFPLFAKKLQNLGVIIDDNIYDLAAFSGFSPVEIQESVDFNV